MTNVTLIRTRSGFANVRDGFAVMSPGDHVDEFTQDAETYVLPDGYHVSESNIGELMIYAANGNYCEIIEHTSGRPQLVGASINQPVLERASD